MKKISVKELTTMVNGLSPGDDITYFNTVEDGEGANAYGITRLYMHDADIVLINYLGGGCPCVIDITRYFGALIDLENDLLSYVKCNRPTYERTVTSENVFVYISHDSQGPICECGCTEFEGILVTKATARIMTGNGTLTHVLGTEDVLSNDYIGPYTCTKCGASRLTLNSRGESGDGND